MPKISLESKYILYRVLTNIIFYNVVWLYFYRIYINDGQIGILDAVAFSIGLLFEIPSGVIADTFGRKKVVRLGQLLVVVGILLQVTFPEFLMFIFGQCLLVIGLSFASGSDDALFYRALGYDSEKSDWKKLVTRASKWTLVGSLFATISGAYLHTINPSYPWYLTALATFFSLFILSGVPDNGSYEKISRLYEIIKNFKNIALGGMGNFQHKKMLVYLPIILGIQSLYYTYGYGLLRIILLDRFHFSAFMGAVVIGLIIILSILSLHYVEKKIEHFREKQVFLGLGVITILSLLVSIGDIGYWGGIALFILYLGERILHTFINDGINKNTSERERATALSIASFIKSFPYVLLAPLIGFLNLNGNLEYFLFGWSFIIVICLVWYTQLTRIQIQ